MNMNCRQCNSRYDHDDLVRTNGIYFAMKGFCTPQCYTEYCTEDTDTIELTKAEISALMAAAGVMANNTESKILRESLVSALQKLTTELKEKDNA